MTTRLRRLLPKSIRGRILFATVTVTLAISASTVFICFSVFQSFLRKTEIQSAEFNLRVVSYNISDHLENILRFEQWCAVNTEISHYLESFEEQEKMPSISSDNYLLRMIALSAYDRLKEEYYNTHSSDYISRIVISPENLRNYLQISPTSDGAVSSVAEVLFHDSCFQDCLAAAGYLWNGFHADPPNPTGDSRYLMIVRPISTQYNQHVSGWIYLAISDRMILDSLKSYPLETDSDLYITIGNVPYHYRNGNFEETTLDWTIVSDLDEPLFRRDSRAECVEFQNGDRRILVTCSLGNEGWTISQVLSEQSYQTQREVYLLIIGGLVLLIILAGILLYVSLNRMINNPVGKLRERIRAISDGDFSADPSIEWEDELGMIGKGINQMSKNVVTLMEKKMEDEKQKRDLEYQILQSQINPHFLYNTLNSIKWMANIQGVSGISEMTTALARLMKSVSKGTTTQIPLKQELDLVNDYFLIQQYRYGGSIELEYRIENDALYECRIHRFTLQPIVENALFHGIEPKGCVGKILIEARESFRKDGTHLLTISVTDNGVGMTEETIERVLAGDSRPSADFFRHVGINNVNRRIQYDYGEEFGIRIDSEPGVYTTMTIVLPYIREEHA